MQLEDQDEFDLNKRRTQHLISRAKTLLSPHLLKKKVVVSTPNLNTFLTGLAVEIQQQPDPPLQDIYQCDVNYQSMLDDVLKMNNDDDALQRLARRVKQTGKKIKGVRERTKNMKEKVVELAQHMDRPQVLNKLDEWERRMGPVKAKRGKRY